MIPNRLPALQDSPIEGVRYGLNCTIFGAHGCVITPWNGVTIPRRYALPCTPKIAHSNPSNCGFQDNKRERL